jgi:hypothetical protein
MPFVEGWQWRSMALPGHPYLIEMKSLRNNGQDQDDIAWLRRIVDET